MTVTDSLRASSAARPERPTLRLFNPNWRPTPRRLSPVVMPIARSLRASRAVTEILPCFGGGECAAEVG